MNRQAGLILAALVAVLATGWGGWYYYLGTPAYSLARLHRALEQGNDAAAAQYLDREGLVGDAIDHLWTAAEAKAIQAPRRKAISNPAEALSAGLAVLFMEVARPMLKTALVAVISRDVDRLVVGEGRPDYARASISRAGDTAVATIPLQGGRVPEVQFVLLRNPDRTWRIARLTRRSLDDLFPPERTLAEAGRGLPGHPTTPPIR